MNNTKKSFIIISLFIIVLGCKKNDELINVSDTFPSIETFYASKDTINFGGDTTTLKIIANGGNLNYLWSVDLGDIIPTNYAYKVTYSGSSCCVGEKWIYCEVSNSLGKVIDSVKVFILEPLK